MNIVDRLKNSLDYEFNLTYSEHKQLLDYITNLQTIEQQYSAILSENAELENKITNLQEETERQSKAQVILDDENAELQGKIMKLQEENERYKNIIKNIEKLVDNQLHGNFVPTGRTDGKVLQEIENKLKELKGE